MERISSIVDKEIEEFYKDYPIERISSISSNWKREMKEIYIGSYELRETRRFSTLNSLGSGNCSDSSFNLKWSLLNSVTKILIADKVDEYLKNN